MPTGEDNLSSRYLSPTPREAAARQVPTIKNEDEYIKSIVEL